MRLRLAIDRLAFIEIIRRGEFRRLCGFDQYRSRTVAA